MISVLRTNRSRKQYLCGELIFSAKNGRSVSKREDLQTFPHIFINFFIFADILLVWNCSKFFGTPLFNKSSLIACKVTKVAFWRAEVLFLPVYAENVSSNGILYPDSIRCRRNLNVPSDFQKGRHFFNVPLTETLVLIPLYFR